MLLVKALKDSHWSLRAAAIEALCELEDPAVIQPIKRATRDKHPRVREAAVEALGDLRDN